MVLTLLIDGCHETFNDAMKGLSIDIIVAFKDGGNSVQ